MYTPLRAGRESNCFVRPHPNENMFKFGVINSKPKDIFVKKDPKVHKIVNSLEKSKQVITKGRVA